MAWEAEALKQHRSAVEQYDKSRDLQVVVDHWIGRAQRAELFRSTTMLDLANENIELCRINTAMDKHLRALGITCVVDPPGKKPK